MRALFSMSAAMVLAAACAHSTRQAVPARMPPAPISEPHAVTTSSDSTREYSGEWESGVETSVFRGCNRTVPANVWVSLAPDAVVDTKWSDNAAGRTTRTFYVRVRGILRGPADRQRVGAGYGPRGVADYELYITRVLEVKPPGQPNCAIHR